MKQDLPVIGKRKRLNTGGAGRRSALHAPAIQALMVQFGSFLVLLATVDGIRDLMGFQVPVVAAVLLQGALAAALSRWLGLAAWWLLIQFVFPSSLVAMQSLHLPPALFLFAFLFLLALYWTTFRTQVPFFPSGPATWQSVAQLLPKDRPVRFVDIGSGLGGLVLHLAERRTDSIFTGIEVAPLPWLASMLRARLGRSRGRFIRGDYEQLNFGDYDVVFAYLSPAAMPALWDKACAEMRPGTLLLSYEFTIPSTAPQINSPCDSRGATLYGWHM